MHLADTALEIHDRDDFGATMCSWTSNGQRSAIERGSRAETRRRLVLTAVVSDFSRIAVSPGGCFAV